MKRRRRRGATCSLQDNMVDVFLGQSFSDRQSRRNNNTAIWFRKLALLMGEKGLAKLEPAGRASRQGKAKRPDMYMQASATVVQDEASSKQAFYYVFLLAVSSDRRQAPLLLRVQYSVCVCVCVCERDGVTRTSFPPVPPLYFFPEQAYTKLFRLCDGSRTLCLFSKLLPDSPFFFCFFLPL